MVRVKPLVIDIDPGEVDEYGPVLFAADDSTWPDRRRDAPKPANWTGDPRQVEGVRLLPQSARSILPQDRGHAGNHHATQSDSGDAWSMSSTPDAPHVQRQCNSISFAELTMDSIFAGERRTRAPC
jgi:hypothetical protein